MSRKRRWATQADADAARGNMAPKKKRRGRPAASGSSYRCPDCGDWHVSSSK